MITCPHCDQKTVPWHRQMSMGPTREITCPNCGNKSTLSWLAWLNLIPYFFTFSWVLEHTRGWGRWVLLALVLSGFALIQIFGIPLVKSKKKRP
jgi:hypothetical protein